MEIGKNLRRLRKEAGITQEELAEQLGVTGQAVSKWECGDGYPDITLLPEIAKRFNVKIDILFGTGNQPSTEEFNKVTEHANTLIINDETRAEGFSLMSDFADKYPGNYNIRAQLAFMHYRMHLIDEQTGLSSESIEHLQKAGELYEEISQNTEDNSMRGLAEHNLGGVYYKLGKQDKLIELINKQKKSQFYDIGDWIAGFSEGNDLVVTAQNNIIEHTLSILSMILRLASIEHKNGKNLIHTPVPGEDEMVFTTSDKIEMLEKGIEIFRIVFGNDYRSVRYYITGHYYNILTELHLKANDKESAIRTLEQYADQVITFTECELYNTVSGEYYLECMSDDLKELSLDERKRTAAQRLSAKSQEMLYHPLASTILTNRLNLYNTKLIISSGTMDLCKFTLEKLKDSNYDPIRSDPRFDKVIQKLKEHEKPDDLYQKELTERINSFRYIL